MDISFGGDLIGQNSGEKVTGCLRDGDGIWRRAGLKLCQENPKRQERGW